MSCQKTKSNKYSQTSTPVHIRPCQYQKNHIQANLQHHLSNSRIFTVLSTQPQKLHKNTKNYSRRTKISQIIQLFKNKGKYILQR